MSLLFPNPGSIRKLGVVFGKIQNSLNEIHAVIDNITIVEFADNRILHNSVFSDLATIGELLKTVTGNPDDENIADPDKYALMATYPTIDWRGLKGFRDVHDHNYYTVDSNMVWNVSLHSIAQLENVIKDIQKNYPEIALEMQKTINGIATFNSQVSLTAREIFEKNQKICEENVVENDNEEEEEENRRRTP